MSRIFSCELRDKELKKDVDIWNKNCNVGQRVFLRIGNAGLVTKTKSIAWIYGDEVICKFEGFNKAFNVKEARILGIDYMK